MTSIQSRSASRGPGRGTETLDLAASLRLAVTRLARRLRQQADTGVTPSMLSALATVERMGPLTLGELAALEGVQRPSMTSIEARLEETGLVTRQVDPTDRRVVRVSVSAQGRQLLDRSRSRKTAYLARRLQAMLPAERKALADAVPILERLLEDEG